jgi:hypothetical protein
MFMSAVCVDAWCTYLCVSMSVYVFGSVSDHTESTCVCSVLCVAAQTTVPHITHRVNQKLP